MGLVQDKVALITGGARGQGRAHALTLAREGGRVVLFDAPGGVDSVTYPLATSSELDSTVSELRAMGADVEGVEGDVRSSADLERAVSVAVEAFGRIDILIANAGVWTACPFWELTDESWNDTVDINLGGVWRAARAVAPRMIERGSGSIVMTASINGHEPGFNYAHYTASKFGVVGLMKAVALELAPYGVRCNAVSPGAIATPMTDHQAGWDLMAGHEGGSREDWHRGGRSFNALRGLGMMPPEVVAHAALFLCSEQASAITGVAIPVDAGHLLLTGSNPNP